MSDRKAYMKKYREENKEKEKARAKKYREENKEVIKAYSKVAYPIDRNERN